MSEIKVGEYVRTINGEIGIFKGYNANSKSQWKYRIEFQKVKTWKYCAECYILKHSKDIIDLIENGDILRYRINNLCAIKIGEVKKYKDARSLKEYLGVEGFSLQQIEILGIITKQQFSNIEYKVVE